MGYATSWMTNVVMTTLGFRSESSMLTPDPIVHSSIPMVHARIVLAGMSTSKFRTDART